MRQTFLTFGLLLLFSCKKDAGTNSLSGLYTENSPFLGRSQLNFINNNLVVKSDTGGMYKDTFSYFISTKKITLTPTWTNQYSGQQLDFKKIDNNTFQIQNLYASIPEAPESYMIFKK
jgi:hypothetical protein